MIYTTSKVYNQKEGKIEEDYLFGREFNGYIELLSGNCIPTLTSLHTQCLSNGVLEEVNPRAKTG